jgi:hypothetical protein
MIASAIISKKILTPSVLGILLLIPIFSGIYILNKIPRAPAAATIFAR